MAEYRIAGPGCRGQAELLRRRGRGWETLDTGPLSRMEALRAWHESLAQTGLRIAAELKADLERYALGQGLPQEDVLDAALREYLAGKGALTAPPKP